jgi:single-stranded-DNA-specific exonuclease
MAQPGFLGSQLEKELIEEHALPVLLSRILAARWRDSDRADWIPYLRPELSRLKGLCASPALQPIIEALKRARHDGTHLLIHGDYDADGITATACIFAVSQHLGMKSNFYVPSRYGEGYGLSTEIVRKAAKEGYKLLLALDCGTSNASEVELAHELGIDVIGIDHHAPGESLPRMPLINPHLTPEIDPLCTAGLAYLFAREWLAAEGEDAELANHNFLEGAAVATIGDHVPLVGDGFILAHNGLERLPRTSHAGLYSLLSALGLYGKSFLTARDVLFSIVPHLNATGRMVGTSAALAVQLMLTQSTREAATIAQKMLRLNQERRKQQELVSGEAAKQALALADAPVVVLYKADWPPGVTSVVAAKVVEMFCKPALVFSDAPSNEGNAVGSGRAPDGVDILATVEPARELFVKLGGHASAIGGTIPIKRLPELRVLLASKPPISLPITPQLEPEVEVSTSDLGSELIGALLRLHPFGEGYSAPRLRIKDAAVRRVTTMGREGTAICIELEAPRNSLRVVGFRMSHLLPSLREGMRVSLDIELGLDNFRAEPALQLMLLRLA